MIDMTGVIALIVHNQSFYCFPALCVFVKTLVKYEIVFYIDTGIIISQQVPVTLIIDFFYAICQLLWKVVYS